MMHGNHKTRVMQALLNIKMVMREQIKTSRWCSIPKFFFCFVCTK